MTECTPSVMENRVPSHLPVMWSELLEASREMQRMDYVHRFSTIPISVPENLSTHSYWVVVYSAMIHHAVSPNDVGTLAACVIQAIVHDTPEMVTGDFVRTFKYRTRKLKEAIDEAEDMAIQELSHPIRSMFDLAATLTSGTETGAYVKAVVKAADFMSLCNFMIREAMRGNREIRPYYDRMLTDLQDMVIQMDGMKFRSMDGEFDPSEFYGQLRLHASRFLHD